MTDTINSPRALLAETALFGFRSSGRRTAARRGDKAPADRINFNEEQLLDTLNGVTEAAATPVPADADAEPVTTAA